MRHIVRVFAAIVLIGMLLFTSAGRLDWKEGWIYVGGWLATFSMLLISLTRSDPELLNERGERTANTKSWDKVLLTIYSVFLFLSPVVAGLDACRYGWSEMARFWHWIGFGGLTVGAILVQRVMGANSFRSTMVRIQDDRGHRVITHGPYRYVRHPTYLGLVLINLSTPLALGSWWTFVPQGVNAMLFIMRTALEDRTLHQELPGYAEFAQRTPYRLLPGVW
jgi:protein-S-isoprenylcysteine O-methyltransferase Ste14